MNQATERTSGPTSAGKRKVHHLWWSASALALVGVLAGCSQQQVTQAAVGGGTKQVEGAVPADGFLPHPELLRTGGAGQADMVYFKPEFAFSDYRSILLDPAAIISRPNSDLAMASSQQRRALANFYYSELYNALKTHCDLARRPGPVPCG